VEETQLTFECKGKGTVTVKVATIQFCPVFRDKIQNLKRLSALVIEAATNGAKLIVLPELSALGYSYMSRLEAEEDSEVLTDFTPGQTKCTTMSVMWALASKYQVTVVFGLIRKDHGTGKVYNSQVYLEPSGYFEQCDKLSRWGNDFIWATPGHSNPPIIRADHLDGLRIGMLICRDVRNKKDDNWKNFYSPGEADIIALSTNWGDGGFPAVSWMDFAEENKVNLIVSNRYGQEGPNDFGEGGVCVITKAGEVLCEGLVWSADCIVYADIP